VTRSVSIGRALADSGLDSLEAQVLLAHALGRDRAWLAARVDAPLAEGFATSFAMLAARRKAGEPVAYLTGTREFWGLPLVVSPAVLIPRPETETLVEAALGWLPVDRAMRVLDLGTGSGAVALALAKERPRARVLASDVSDAALAVACENARRLALTNVAFVQADWYEGLADVLPSEWHERAVGSATSEPGAGFDLIVSNPPYVSAGDPHLTEGDLRFEPIVALTPGGDGLEAIRRIIAGARRWLVPGGRVAFEHGYDQAADVRSLLGAAGCEEIGTWRDLAGIERVSAARVPD
jgi:release factor glutamine methyltransferase